MIRAKGVTKNTSTYEMKERPNIIQQNRTEGNHRMSMQYYTYYFCSSHSYTIHTRLRV